MERSDIAPMTDRMADAEPGMSTECAGAPRTADVRAPGFAGAAAPGADALTVGLAQDSTR